MNKLIIIFCILLFSCSSGKQQLPEPGEFSTEEKTETSPGKVLHKKPNFQLERYANWTIDSSDKSFEPENYLDLNSASDNGFAMFFIFETQIDEKEHIDDQVKGYVDKLVKNPKVSYFGKWGAYRGQGAKIEGALMGLMKGEIRIFAHATDSLSFLTISMLYLEDRPVDEPGFELIESTFRLKE